MTVVALGASDSSPFAVPTDNGLCTREDIEQIFSPSVIVKWAVMSGVTATSSAGITEITNRINWAIGLASSEFRNAMRQGGYVLTGVNNGLVPAGTTTDCLTWQRNVVAVQAGLLLYVHLRPTQRGEDGRPTPDRYDGLFTWAESQINFVRARKLKLDAQTFGSGSNGPFVTRSPSHAAYASGLGNYGPPSFGE